MHKNNTDMENTFNNIAQLSRQDHFVVAMICSNIIVTTWHIGKNILFIQTSHLKEHSKSSLKTVQLKQ